MKNRKEGVPGPKFVDSKCCAQTAARKVVRIMRGATCGITAVKRRKSSPGVLKMRRPGACGPRSEGKIAPAAPRSSPEGPQRGSRRVPGAPRGHQVAPQERPRAAKRVPKGLQKLPWGSKIHENRPKNMVWIEKMDFVKIINVT